jgi:hypothetical protein
MVRIAFLFICLTLSAQSVAHTKSSWPETSFFLSCGLAAVGTGSAFTTGYFGVYNTYHCDDGETVCCAESLKDKCVECEKYGYRLCAKPVPGWIPSQHFAQITTHLKSWFAPAMAASIGVIFIGAGVGLSPVIVRRIMSTNAKSGMPLLAVNSSP